MMTIQSATLGYPRIGKNREVKKALEAFWSGKLDTDSLLQEEVIPALKHMVEAAKALREEVKKAS